MRWSCWRRGLWRSNLLSPPPCLSGLVGVNMGVEWHIMVEDIKDYLNYILDQDCTVQVHTILCAAFIVLYRHDIVVQLVIHIHNHSHSHIKQIKTK